MGGRHLILAIRVFHFLHINIIGAIVSVDELGLVDLMIFNLAVYVRPDTIVLFADVRVLRAIVNLAYFTDLIIVDVRTSGTASVFVDTLCLYIGLGVIETTIIGFSKLHVMKTPQHGSLNCGSSDCKKNGSHTISLLLDTNRDRSVFFYTLWHTLKFVSNL